jgi:hypothetical protein
VAWVDVGDGEQAHGAILVERVDHAPVCQRWYGQAGHTIESDLVVE